MTNKLDSLNYLKELTQKSASNFSEIYYLLQINNYLEKKRNEFYKNDRIRIIFSAYELYMIFRIAVVIK